MAEEKTSHQPGAQHHWIVAVAFLVLLILAFRNTGLYPTVFADEWSYSKFSRLIPLAEVPVPSYLYFSLFNYTNHCGDGFLDCARIINSAFFVGAIPFIYLIAARASSRRIAAFVALLAALSTVNTYTAYFMPEAMYFFFFWLFSWCVLSHDGADPLRFGLLSGAIIASMTMVKVHAVFLAPGFIVFVAYFNFLSYRRDWVRRTIATIFYFAFFALTLRLALGYVFAGKNGLSMVGNLYGQQAGSALNPGRHMDLLPQAAQNLKSHLMTLSVLFGVPLAAAISLCLDKNADTRRRLAGFYAIAVLVPLLFIVALFTAAVVGTGPSESIARLHMRYYNFALPLFFIIAASQLHASPMKNGIARSLPYALPVGLLAAYSTSALLPAVETSFIDNPELRGLAYNPSALPPLAGFGAFTVFAWAVDRKLGARLFVFAFMPLSVLLSAYHVNGEVRQRMVADLYDKAGLFARHQLEEDDRARLTVAGSPAASLYRALFQIDNPHAGMLAIPDGAPLRLSQIPAGMEWVLLVGDHAPPPDVKYQIRRNGYSLLRIAGGDVIDFRKSSWLGVVDNISGLSTPEHWGSWSNAKQVRLDLSAPLPKQFDLRLKAQAFGPNAGEPFAISIGPQRKSFHLASSQQDLSLSFQTDGTEKTIVIEIPKPVSPKELGLSGDARRLGIGLAELRIVSAD